MMSDPTDALAPGGGAAVAEALRAAHELCAYLVNNMEAEGDEFAPNVEFSASTMAHAEQFAALVNDARDKTASALAVIERDLAGAAADATRQHLQRLRNPPT